MSESDTNGTEVSENLERAFLLLQQGSDAEEAEILVLRPVVEAERDYGTDSPEYMDAVNDLGRFLILAGDAGRAADAFRKASEGPMPREREAAKRWLTCRSNLGEALRAIGDWEESEQVLREGLEQRRAFYGKDHPGYAYGLEPLAELLLTEERYDDALALVEAAAFNYVQNQHPRFIRALALRAEIMARAGRPSPLFPSAEGFAPSMVVDLVDAVQARIAGEEPAVALLMLDDLLPIAVERLGEDDEATIRVLTFVAEMERRMGRQGNDSIRQDALRRIADASLRRGEVRETLRALQGLALAQSQSGDKEAALETYRQAEQCAEHLGDPAERSRLLRNYGLYLSEEGMDDEAERMLREAVTVAGFAEDAEMRARGQVALGIFLQHHGQNDEAETLLSAALNALSPIEPDAVTARGHLDAIRTGHACGCGDTGNALAEAFREYLLPQLPADLVNDIEVGVTDDSQFEVSVDARREPTEAEHARIQSVINRSLAEFRQRLGR